MAGQRICLVEDCDRPHEALGFCAKHYRRWRRSGDPLVVPPRPNKGRGPAQLFLKSVLAGSAPVEPNGCILWPFFRDKGGYARAATSERQVNVYWEVLEHFHGPRPSDIHTTGHALHEICGNRHCLAPAHLSWQTPWEQNQQQLREGTVRNGNPTIFTVPERVAVAKRMLAGESQGQIAKDYGVHATTVGKWARWAIERGLVETEASECSA